MNFLVEGYNKRGIILSLAKRSFGQQYFGSAIGFFWAFIEPLMFTGVLYLVFSLGMRVGTGSEVPFVVYLISGIAAWLYFASTMSSSSNSIAQYSYLVNNLGFRTSFLPIINIVGNLIPHAFFIALAVAVTWSNGYTPSFYTLQILYYLFSMCVLLLGLSWLTSSTNLFIKDISRLVLLVVQFGFWLTPVFWSSSIVPERYLWIVKLNPMYYVVNGYRDSLVNQIPFWHHSTETIYFWTITLLILAAGIVVFNKLEPHFGDVIQA